MAWDQSQPSAGGRPIQAESSASSTLAVDATVWIDDLWLCPTRWLGRRARVCRFSNLPPTSACICWIHGREPGGRIVITTVVFTPRYLADSPRSISDLRQRSPAKSRSLLPTRKPPVSPASAVLLLWILQPQLPLLPLSAQPSAWPLHTPTPPSVLSVGSTYSGK